MDYVSRSQINEKAMLEILAGGEEVPVMEIYQSWYKQRLPQSAIDRTKKSLRDKGIEIVSVRRSKGWTWRLVKPEQDHV